MLCRDAPDLLTSFPFDRGLQSVKFCSREVPAQWESTLGSRRNSLAKYSTKIPGFALQAAGEVAEVVHPVGDQVVHVAVGFQHTVHG
jgi:hypothetical protein